ncbi:MAG: thiol reductant ABC exporter subunit CydC, partial [Alphaproteobacteria bacterium]
WWLFLLAPAAGLLHWLESWMAHDTAFRMLTEMRIRLFAKLDELAPAYLLRRRTGDLVGMATSDVETVEYFFAHTIAPAFVAVLIPAAVLAVLGWAGWPMAAALLPFLLAVAVSPVLLRGRIDRLAGKAREALGDLNAHAADTVQGLAEIAAFGHEARRGDEFMARIARHQGLRLPFYRDLTMQHAILEAATGLGGLAVVLSGAALVQAGRLDPALLPLMSILAMAAFLPVSEIAQIGRQLADTLGATRRLHAVHSEPPAVADGPGAGGPGIPVPDAGGGAALALEDVRYRYRGTPLDALKGVSLSVPAGATVALVGPSGAGKTTVAHMLLRFWDPDSGRVTMDGRDLRDWRLDELRRRIALVAQDTYLFNDTLEANIRIARPDASDAALRQAVARAALGEFVDALPEGLATPVGERGMQLSGGQRQRVAIARAFLKDAPVLILDEATSHLDAVSEALVRRALDDLMADRTTVVIAHRLSTVRDADLIVAMADGRAVEAGTHAALLAQGGLYARLVAHQMTAAAAD